MNHHIMSGIMGIIMSVSFAVKSVSVAVRTGDMSTTAMRLIAQDRINGHRSVVEDTTHTVQLTTCMSIIIRWVVHGYRSIVVEFSLLMLACDASGQFEREQAAAAFIVNVVVGT